MKVIEYSYLFIYQAYLEESWFKIMEVSLMDGKIIFIIVAPPKGAEWLCSFPLKSAEENSLVYFR